MKSGFIIEGNPRTVRPLNLMERIKEAPMRFLMLFLPESTVFPLFGFRKMTEEEEAELDEILGRTRS